METTTPTYVSFRAEAPWTTTKVRELILEAKAEAERRKILRIFLDLTKWTEPESEMTRYSSGEFLARQLPRPYRVAAVGLATAINRFGENVAVNRWADFRIFSEEAEAMTWLMGEPLFEGEQASAS